MNQRIKKIEKVINTRIGQRENEPINFYSIPEEERERMLNCIRAAQRYCDRKRINIDKLPEEEFLAIINDFKEKFEREGWPTGDCEIHDDFVRSARRGTDDTPLIPF